MKAELGGPSPSPLERLLVQRVAATWLQVNYYDALAAQAQGSDEVRQKMIQRRQESADRRHLTALKTLATVRKLLTPSLSRQSRSPVGSTALVGSLASAARASPAPSAS